MNHKKEAEFLLKNYNDLIHSIDNLNHEIELIGEEMTSLQSVKLGEIKGSGNSDDRISKLIHKKMLKERALKITKNKINYIEKTISEMQKDYPDEVKVLKAFYFEKLKGYEIENKCNVTYRHAYKIKDKALRIFAIRLYGIDATN